MATFFGRICLTVLLCTPLALASSRQLAAETTPRLSCYNTVTKSQEGQDLQIAAVAVRSQARFNAVQSSVASQGEAACMRAKVKCADGYNAQLCTKADNDAQAWKLAYMLTTQPACAYFQNEAVQAGVAKDVLCCSTDNCNMDRTLDATTKVLAP